MLKSRISRSQKNFYLASGRCSVKKLLLLFILAALSTSSALAQPNQWPTFHGDPARTGFSNSPAPPQPTVLWQLTVGQLKELEGGGFETNWPIISGDKVFLSGMEIRALDLKTGKILWRYQDKSVPFFPHGLAVADNKLFVTVNDTDNLQTMKTGYVYALDAETGTFLWKTQVAKDPSHSLPLVVEGKVFVGDDSGTLNALDAETGKILWQKKLAGNGEIHSSPAYADGLVFVGTEGDARYQDQPKNPSSMFALNPSTGEIVWQFPIDYAPDRVNLIHATPAVSNGIVYFGSENGWFYALNASDGSLIWKKELATGRDMIGTSAAAGLGFGKVFVSLWSGKFLALDQKSGEVVWEFSYEGNGTDSSPIVADNDVLPDDGASGFPSFSQFYTSPSAMLGSSPRTEPLGIRRIEKNKIYLGAHEGYFYCFDAETGKVLWQEKLGGPSAALANGILVVPNALAGENVGDPQTPVLVAFAAEGQTALNWTPTQLGDTLEKTNPLPLVLIFAGAGVLAVCGIFFFRRR